MNRRLVRGCFIFLLLLLLVAPGRAVDLRNRSTSSSGQFIVYCDDREVRSRIVSAAEEIKTDILRVLHVTDFGKFPIVISIEPADPEKPLPPAAVQLVNTIAGPKIDIVVHVGDDPAKVFLQRHIIRALLLDMAYRDRPALKPDQPYTESPWWLVEGIIQILRRRDVGADRDVFKSIVASDKLPPFEKFLTQTPVHLGTVAGTVDSACAMCLVEALVSLPEGHGNLGRFIRKYPDAGGDVLGTLASQFPTLNESPQSLAKWWTLQLARFAGNDGSQGLTIAESDAELARLLTLDIVLDKNGHSQQFEFADFDKYIKLPATKLTLHTLQVKLTTLGTKVNPHYRPILTEYQTLSSQLAAGKTKGAAVRIAAIEKYRTTVVQRIGQITDYLNWYEATQTPGRSGTFDEYLRRSDPPKLTPLPADPRIVDYLDTLEHDFAPLLPNALPVSAPNGAASR